MVLFMIIHLIYNQFIYGYNKGMVFVMLENM